MDVVVSPVHSASPQSQFDDHASPLNDKLAETPMSPPASLIEFSSANDLTPYSLPAQDSGSSGPMVELLDSGPMVELLGSVSDDEAVLDVRAPVIIDVGASPYPASSIGTSSDDLSNVLSLPHVQDAGSQQQQSGTNFETSSRNHTTQSSGYGSQSHNVLNTHGHGPSQYGHRGRREPSRGNRHWNVRHPGFNGRNYMHTPLPPRGLPTPIHPFSPYLPPFSPWGPELAWSPLWHPGPVPHYMPPPHGHGNFSAVLESELRLKIVKQIEYYFSYSNLVTDEYLRRRMDEQGWVPVRIIAGFPKIKQLTDNIQIVFDALRTSAVLEILGDKVRLRFDWERWRIPMDAPGYAV